MTSPNANAYDIELAIARNERARKHAGDNRQIVDERRNHAAARRDKRKYMLGDEIHGSSPRKVERPSALVRLVERSVRFHIERKISELLPCANLSRATSAIMAAWSPHAESGGMVRRTPSFLHIFS